MEGRDLQAVSTLPACGENASSGNAKTFIINGRKSNIGAHSSLYFSKASTSLYELPPLAAKPHRS
jgi:hypothetical protein